MAKYRYRFYDDKSRQLCLEHVPVVRETPKGAWINRLDGSGPAFVKNGEGKRYAHQKVTWALESYLARREAMANHARAALKRTEDAQRLGARAQEWLKAQPEEEHTNIGVFSIGFENPFGPLLPQEEKVLHCPYNGPEGNWDIIDD